MCSVGGWSFGVGTEYRDNAPWPVAVSHSCWMLPSGSARRCVVAPPSAAVCDNTRDDGSTGGTVARQRGAGVG